MLNKYINSNCVIILAIMVFCHVGHTAYCTEDVAVANTTTIDDKNKISDNEIVKDAGLKKDEKQAFDKKKEEPKKEEIIFNSEQKTNDEKNANLPDDSKNQNKKQEESEKVVLKQPNIVDENKNDSEEQQAIKVFMPKDNNVVNKQKNNIPADVDMEEKVKKDKKDILKPNLIVESKMEKSSKPVAFVEEKKDNGNNNKKETSNNKKNTQDKLFTIFDTKKALNFDYNKIKGENYGFLEREEELKVIKHIILEQQDSNMKKISDEEARKKNALSTIVEIAKERGKIKHILRLYSLVFFNNEDWSCRVNKQIINYKNKNGLKSDVVSVLKVDKNSVVFVMNNTTDKLIKTVKSLIAKKVPYYDNYYIVKLKHKSYVAFKLFIGQEINLDNMVIEG